MPLVSYSSSSDSEDEVPPHSSATVDVTEPPADSKLNPRKRKLDSTLPPLPTSFHDLYASNARLSTRDDPSLHDGRKRSIPHVAGNWPSHVYLEWYPTAAESQSLTQLLSHLEPESSQSKQQLLQSLLYSALAAPLPLHISLSRTLPIRTEQREPFLSALGAAISRTGVRPFRVTFDNARWEANFERSRWFLVLGVRYPDQGSTDLDKLLAATNEVVKEFGMERLYCTPGTSSRRVISKRNERFRNVTNISPANRGGEDRAHDNSSAFHVSIAWTLQEPNKEWKDMINDDKVRAIVRNDVQHMQVAFENVKVRIGNTVEVVDLAKKVGSNSGGILG